MGNNFYGRLGLGDQSLSNTSVPCLVESLVNEKIISVTCGSTHTVAINKEGEVYSWGLGEFGALGTGNITTMYCPTKIDFFPKNRIKIISASCGNRHTVFVGGKNNIKIR